MSSSAPQSPRPYDDSPTKVSNVQKFQSPYLSVSRVDMVRARSLTPRRGSPFPPRHNIRTRLKTYNTLDDAVKLLKSSNNIVVLTGAGISTSLGIPDFRSSKGLYNALADAGYTDPQELFEIETFLQDPARFFRNVAPIIPRLPGVSGKTSSQKTNSESKPKSSTDFIPRYSATHAFLALLQSRGQLLTNYTQNIDGLESAAGVDEAKLVQCHGTWATATCITCSKKVPARKYLPVVYNDQIPFCKCMNTPPERKKVRREKKKKKRHEFEDTSSEDEDLNGPRGLLKPDITFFGEGVANNYKPRLDIDKHSVDLLLIIGTSLKVAPVNEMLTAIPPEVPQIWISKERCQREGVKVDIELLGECDVVINELCRRAQWSKSLKSRTWEQRRQPKEQGSIRLKQPIIKPDDVKEKSKTCPVQINTNVDKHPLSSNKVDDRPSNSDRPVVSVAEQAIPVKRSENTISSNERTMTPAIRPHPGHRRERSATPTRGDEAEERVIVEREEGTDYRWFVRLAK